MLQITDLTLRIAGRTLLERATITLPERTKAGLVGRNGTGKTTLFRAICEEMSPDTGSISLPKNSRIGRVEQEVPGGPATLLETVLAADTERSALLEEAETALDANRIAEIHVRLNDIGAHDAEARASRILAGLGFSVEAQNTACSEFSGGWRMRVALAAILFMEPDLLLLDEPTNYLDLEGTLWLERYLSRYPHSVLLISHDRDLLNRSVESIVHLQSKKLTVWRGGYDEFERQYREQQELQGKIRAKQVAQRKHMQAFVDRFRAKASKARQAQSRLKAIAKLAPIAETAVEAVTPIHFPIPAKRAAPPIIAMEAASVGYKPGAPVLQNLNLSLDNDDRIALLGQNGNGKSTFAKLLAGDLEVEDGRYERSNKLKVGYFAQHQVDALLPGQSAFEHVRAHLPDLTEAQARARVARMGLSTDKMDTAAANLSGGEKARLVMGLAAIDAPHLLILDEPTNHLDIDSREALVYALNEYDGAVILISHDRHLIEACAERLWLVEKGTIEPFDGDIDDYRRYVLKGPQSGAKAAAKNEPRDASNAREDRQKSATRRAAAAPIRKKIRECEIFIDDITKKIQSIDKRLSDTDLYRRDPDEAARLAQLRSQRAEKLEKAEEIWLELSEMSAKLEAAE